MTREFRSLFLTGQKRQQAIWCAEGQRRKAKPNAGSAAGKCLFHWTGYAKIHTTGYLCSLKNRESGAVSEQMRHWRFLPPPAPTGTLTHVSGYRRFNAENIKKSEGWVKLPFSFSRIAQWRSRKPYTETFCSPQRYSSRKISRKKGTSGPTWGAVLIGIYKTSSFWSRKTKSEADVWSRLESTWASHTTAETIKEQTT